MTRNYTRQTITTAKDPGYILLTLYMLAAAIIALASWCQTAGATVGESPVNDELQGGQLLFPGESEGEVKKAPLLSMDVDITISGIVSRTSVKQKFTNNTGKWAEARYIFPLPDESAVDHLEMQIGDRHIVGHIKGKEEAKKTYEAAKKAGKKASLLSQQRPNIFTTSVANIAPGETITITIEYQQIVQRQDTLYSLRFPMVVGPRYHPGASTFSGPTTLSFDTENSGSTTPKNRKTDNNMLVQPPVLNPLAKPLNPVQLHINLAAGMELESITSLYHGISQQTLSDHTIDIVFTGEVLADRDFVLEWQAKESTRPTVSLFSEQANNENYLLLMVMPPAREQSIILPRETIFILDTSGSMGGESIRQAKKALLLAVARMRPEDRFNVIEFNSETNRLFSASKAGNPENLQKAYHFIDQLEARGGTEIRPALEMALDGRSHHQRIRQVVFLTDACVTNEMELFNLIGRKLGDSRLFTVGIGSAPNSYFMTRAATMGRGSYTYIGKFAEVREKMITLFEMLEHPAMTDLQINGDALAEILPSPLPDLYQGEPLLALIQTTTSPGDLTLSGNLPGQAPWQIRIQNSDIAIRPGIAKLWARKKIRILMDKLAAGGDSERVKQRVTKLALDNHLVSRYTSLVAVEEVVSRPQNENVVAQNQKINFPAGWQYDKVFAGSASTASPASLFFLIGLLLLATARLFTRIIR